MSTSKKEHIIWSEEEVKQLLELIETRVHIKDISTALRKSEKSIRRKCERLKISCATIYKKQTAENSF
jgi:transcriptional regulator with PAS, ATPase and Fis domain